MKKGVGFNQNEKVNYLDHVGVICSIMGFPLIVIDEVNETLAKKFYPGLEVIKMDYDDLTPDFLFSNFDVLFLSEYWEIQTLYQMFGHLEKKYRKEIRVVHCPHWFSDKSYYLNDCVNEDIVLVYGEHMIEMIKGQASEGFLQSLVVTGNYRFSYYKKHRAFYQEKLIEEVLKNFKKEQPTILYAPTWQDSFEATTFFDASHYLVENLPSTYNLIVKPHPLLEIDDIAEYYMILNMCEERENVSFVHGFPPVYPLLDYVDIFIGDTSSVGYDFLVFDKPMFFLNKFDEDPFKERRLLLYRCGTSIGPEQYDSIYEVIESELPTDHEKYSQVRKELYAFTFGPERSFDEIREEIKRAYSGRRAI